MLDQYILDLRYTGSYLTNYILKLFLFIYVLCAILWLLWPWHLAEDEVCEILLITSNYFVCFNCLLALLI